MDAALKSTILVATGALLGVTTRALAQVWVQTSAPDAHWGCVASSADAQRLVAAVQLGGIYVSTDWGTNWTLTSAPNRYWISLASSADGGAIAAAAGVNAAWNSGIYLSTDGGASWASNAVPAGDLRMIVSSADGQKLQAVIYDRALWSSINGGATWITERAPPYIGLSVACSADGAKQVVPARACVFTSTNTGVSWVSNYVGSPYGAEWIVCSADGSQLAALDALHATLFTSTNFGATWRSNFLGLAQSWRPIACSADGQRLVLGLPGSMLLVSTNGGLDFESTSAPYRNWTGVAASADGGRLVAVASGSYYSGPGGIWVSQSILRPQLRLQVSNQEVLSWTVPSTEFIVQETSDLTAPWTSLSNRPALNLSTLCYEVLLPRQASNKFYRLAMPQSGSSRELSSKRVHPAFIVYHRIRDRQEKRKRQRPDNGHARRPAAAGFDIRAASNRN